MFSIERNIAICPRQPTLVVWLGLLLLFASFAAPGPVRAEGDEDEAVSAGAKALDNWWDYPWYDDKTDDVRRIKLKANSDPRPTRTISGATGSSGGWALDWLGWLLIIAVAIVVLLMMARAYWNRNVRAKAAGTPDLVGTPSSIDRLEELPFQLQQPTGDLLTAARRAYELGNYNQAIVFLYSHQLLALDKRDAIRLTKGKTNRQYLRELRAHPQTATLLASSMVAFEDVFFGGHSLSRERFEACYQQATQLLELGETREAA